MMPSDPLVTRTPACVNLTTICRSPRSDAQVLRPAGRPALGFRSPCARPLVGPNGSGKSTLIRALVGLLEAEGEVSFNGAPRSPESARELSYVPQIAPRIPAQVAELVRTVASVRRVSPSAVAEVAAALGMDLERIGRQPFKDLSGGMKQKLLLALALAARARVYVLDEPTASLDAPAREQFFQLFARRAAGATLILCSHRIEEIHHLVDHVVALNEGRVTYDGPAAPYLSARGEALIEVRVRGADIQDWLRAQGFSENPGGWWGKSVSKSEKLPLVVALTQRLDGQLENIQIRDLERLDPEAPAERRLDG